MSVIKELHTRGVPIGAIAREVERPVDVILAELDPKGDKAGKDSLNMLIGELDLPARLRNAVASEFKTVGDLMASKPNELLRMPNIGQKSIESLVSAVESLGIDMEEWSEGNSKSYYQVDQILYQVRREHEHCAKVAWESFRDTRCEELADCPCCGDRPTMLYDFLFRFMWIEGSYHIASYYVECRSCGLNNKSHQVKYTSLDSAVAAWNRCG